MSNEQLEQLRSELDDVNLKLLSLINERAGLVQKSAQLNANQGLIVLIQFVSARCLIILLNITKDHLKQVRFNIYSSRSLRQVLSHKKRITVKHYLFQERNKKRTQSLI